MSQYVDIIKKYAATNQIVIAGVSRDYARAEKMKAEMYRNGINALNICGKTNLSDLILLIKHATDIISVETAGLHISLTLRKPTFAIVGGGHWGRFFPWGECHNTRWLNNKMDCFQCDWKCKYGDYRCVGNIN
jgi:ADP-heptose:LPS heptosyltransferase